MIDKTKLNLFKELFDSSQSILIMCAENSARDELFAATSLFTSLKQSTEKSVKLLCPVDLSIQETDVINLDQLKTEIGHENLCITLDYLEGSIDKVSYHTDEELKKFYLTIKPKNGVEPLDNKNVSFSYTGAKADMIILIGVTNLEDLKHLYIGYENLFSSSNVVSINSFKIEFGSLKFVTTEVMGEDGEVEDATKTSCFSEFVTQLLLDLNFLIDDNSATNLLKGINEETNSFSSYSATADTFETIACLVRAGARRGVNNKTQTDLNGEVELKKN